MLSLCCGLKFLSQPMRPRCWSPNSLTPNIALRSHRPTTLSGILEQSCHDIQFPCSFLESYFFGCSAAWTTFGTFKIHNTWSWRVPSALQALPSVLQVFLIWFVPESPRFLVSKGKEAQALHTLAYYHADGNECVPFKFISLVTEGAETLYSQG